MKILDEGTKVVRYSCFHLWQHDMNIYYYQKYGEFPKLNSGGW